MTDFLLSLLTPENIAWAVTAILGLVAGLIGANVVRRRRIALATYHAFHIVQDIADETPGKDAADYIAAALKAANDYMVKNGWRPLKEGEKALVEVGVQSLKGQ